MQVHFCIVFSSSNNKLSRLVRVYVIFSINCCVGKFLSASFFPYFLWMWTSWANQQKQKTKTEIKNSKQNIRESEIGSWTNKRLYKTNKISRIILVGYFMDQVILYTTMSTIHKYEFINISSSVSMTISMRDPCIRNHPYRVHSIRTAL